MPSAQTGLCAARRRRAPLAVAILAVSGAVGAVSGAGCGPGGGEEESRLTVFAASSLTDAFDALGPAFEAAHPEARLVRSYAGSQVLRIQIEHGAPADVFASADRRHVEALRAAGLVEEPVVFAHNALTVIVPRDNPAGIERFEDLPRARRLVLGDANVPVGHYTERLLRHARARYGAGFGASLEERVVSRESNVRLVRAKVELGEADAAIVYRTDAVSSDRVRAIPIPEEIDVRADYLVAVVASSDEPALARSWVAFLRSAEGRAALEAQGFETD